MPDLVDIALVSREDRMNEIGDDSSACAGNNFRRWGRRTPSDIVIPSDLPLISDHSQDRGNAKVDGNGGLIGQTTEGKKEGSMSQREYYQREECGRGIMKDVLNMTLIAAGLLSVTALIFIIGLRSKFQPNPNEETKAILRVAIHMLNNTTFGSQVPTIPQRTGLSRGIVQARAIFFADLSVLLLCAFLAILGRLLLSQYTPFDVRGTTIERSKYRQRKLGGIVNWYFDHVVESLLLIMQAAVLLLFCGACRFVWEISKAAVLIPLGVISLLFLFYLSAVIVRGGGS